MHCVGHHLPNMTVLYQQHRRANVTIPAVAPHSVTSIEGSDYRSCSKSNLDLSTFSALVPANPVMHNSDNPLGESVIPLNSLEPPLLTCSNRRCTSYQGGDGVVGLCDDGCM